jgi:cell division protein FtsB
MLASLLKLGALLMKLGDALFSYLRDRQLKNAGRNEVLLEEARENERMRRERETLDERVRRMGDGTSDNAALAELRRTWSRE